MPLIIKTIETKSMGIAVNCYLVQSSTKFFLIDTGIARKKDILDRDLESLGCRPGNLKLIILTHGDLDHTGNAAYLHGKFEAKVAMHKGDLVNVETGDMFVNKNVSPFAKTIARGLFFVTRLSQFDTFTPDVLLDDGQDLSGFGLEAIVIHLPGHSKGSIGVLTAEGDLFCGDLMENIKKPDVNSLGDDRLQMRASVEKLSNYRIRTVYPGHGQPFTLDRLSKG